MELGELWLVPSEENSIYTEFRYEFFMGYYPQVNALTYSITPLFSVHLALSLPAAQKCRSRQT